MGEAHNLGNHFKRLSLLTINAYSDLKPENDLILRMPQSLIKNNLHIVFSTKMREPLIYSPFDTKLYAYIAAISNEMGCNALKVGGHLDHIHILCSLSSKVALMNLVEEIKTTSSKWMKHQSPDLSNFYWQKGYAAFSVSPNHLENVKHYIGNQHIHHSDLSFQNELRSIFRSINVDYDEKYI